MKFSIVTPVYNGEKYIKETIESVLSQEGDFEIEYIIRDGCSTDKTIEIIKKYDTLLKEKKYPVRCNEVTFSFVSEKDNGMYNAINKGFSQASGDVYAWINSDDKYLSKAFQKIAKTFSTFQEVDWLKGNIFLTDENSKITQKNPCYIYNQDWIRLGIYGRYAYFISQESVFWRSSLWKKIGKIDEKFKLAGDYYLWTQFAKYTPLWSLDAPLSCFRKRQGQLSEDSKTYQKEQKIIVPPLKDFNTFIIRAFFWFRMKAPASFEPFLFRLYKIVFQKRNRFYVKMKNSSPEIEKAHSFIA
jgi:glycosyltransferase involved in cell wall biosynthesis